MGNAHFLSGLSLQAYVHWVEVSRFPAWEWASRSTAIIYSVVSGDDRVEAGFQSGNWDRGKVRASKSLIDDEAELSDWVDDLRTNSYRARFISEYEDSGGGVACKGDRSKGSLSMRKRNGERIEMPNLFWGSEAVRRMILEKMRSSKISGVVALKICSMKKIVTIKFLGMIMVMRY